MPPCTVAAKRLAAFLHGDHKGHTLWVAVAHGGGTVAICSMCGRYSERRLKKLDEPCPGRRGRAAMALPAVRRAFGRARQHPDPRKERPLRAGPWRVSEIRSLSGPGHGTPELAWLRAAVGEIAAQPGPVEVAEAIVADIPASAGFDSADAIDPFAFIDDDNYIDDVQ